MKIRSLLLMLCTALLLTGCGMGPDKTAAPAAGGPTYRVILSDIPDPHDSEILEHRLEDWVGKGNYTMKQEEDRVRIEFDETACQGLGAKAFTESWLSSHGKLVIGRRMVLNFLGGNGVARDIMVVRPLEAGDIESMEISMAENGNVSPNEGDEATAEEPLPILEDFGTSVGSKIVIQLTPEAGDEIRELCRQYDDLVLFRGNKELIALEDGEKLVIDCENYTLEQRDHLWYNLSHLEECLSRSYQSKLFYDTEEWKDGYTNWVYTPKYSYVPGLGERKQMQEIFESRLDELGMEYELSQTMRGVITVRISGEVNEALMSSLTADSARLQNRHNRVCVASSRVTWENDWEHGKLCARFPEELGESLPEEIHVGMGYYPIAKADSEDYRDGRIEFSEMCFSEGEYNRWTPENPYARFLAKILTGDKLPYEIGLTCYGDSVGGGDSEMFSLPLPNFAHREEMKKSVLAKYPEATFNSSYSKGQCDVRLHLQPEEINMEELVADMAGFAEICDGSDGLDTLFFPCDPLRQEHFELGLYYTWVDDEEGAPPHGAVYLDCHNGRMDALKEDFYAAVSKQPIFTDAKNYDRCYLEVDIE